MVSDSQNGAASYAFDDGGRGGLSAYWTNERTVYDGEIAVCLGEAISGGAFDGYMLNFANSQLTFNKQKEQSVSGILATV